MAAEDDALTRDWELTLADMAEVLRGRGTDHRLRCIVQLCALRVTGWFAADYRRIRGRLKMARTDAIATWYAGTAGSWCKQAVLLITLRKAPSAGRQVRASWGASAKARGNVASAVMAVAAVAQFAPTASPSKPYSTGATAPAPITPV